MLVTMTNDILNQLTFLVYDDTQWTQVLMEPVNGQIKKALERLLFPDSHPGETDCHLLTHILSFVELQNLTRGYLDPCQLLLQSLRRCQDCLDCIRCDILTRVRCDGAGAKVFHLYSYMVPFSLVRP